MEKIILFIVENWRLLVECASVILALVLFILRKRPVKVFDSVKDTIWSILPSLINEAEKVFPESGKGVEKGQFVVGAVWKYLHDTYAIDDFDFYTDFIKSAVEYILSTPQKKGE